MGSTVPLRFMSPVLSVAQTKSAFSGGKEHQRMAQIRKYIEIVRNAWLSTEGYREMINTVNNYCKKSVLPTEVRRYLDALFDGFRDYADVDAKRLHRPEQYDALELYCSDQGYTYLFKLMSEVLRSDTATEDLLLTATIFVEFVTIDLYNLRLSQIGDPRYFNYAGITYRGLSINLDALKEYQEMIETPDLSMRGFAVPLALVSSSSEKSIMQQFATAIPSDNSICMYWEIHIHGIDPDLLDFFHKQYPRSVVTSICAMPVGRVSPFGEKEILLRGVFFQLIALQNLTIQGREVVKAVLVACNANRDHTTETASDENEKKLERESFARIVMASKYEVCASVAEQYSRLDAAGYRLLQDQKLQAIRDSDHIETTKHDDLAELRSGHTAVWLGGSSSQSFPRSYVALRMQWQEAVENRNWLEIEKLLEREYPWRRSEWFSIGKLSGGYELSPMRNHTLLHELVSQQVLDTEDHLQYEAWKRLLEEAGSKDIWKSVRSFDDFSTTAYELALHNGLDEIAQNIRPIQQHNVTPDLLSRIELQLHALMREKAGKLLDEHAFLLPQLSILLEMDQPRLWIPIPAMYGGFWVQLQKQAARLIIYESKPGHAQPERTEFWLRGD